MNKTNSYKKLLTTLLIIVFFTPTMIKVAHLLYEHHQNTFVFNSTKLEINGTHQDCPICVFQFTEILPTEKYQEYETPLVVSNFKPFFGKNISFKSVSSFSFNLRAPPVI